MRKALVSIAILMIASFAFADHMEFDLDDVQGNGPDVIHAEVSDYILVDVWFFNDLPMLSFGVHVLQLDGSLEFQGCEYFVGSWTAVAPVPGPEFDLQATDWSMTAPMQNVLVATVTFHAAVDCSVDDIQGMDASYMATDYGTYFIPAIGGTVEIGGSGTEETNWGAVKGLFR